MVLHQTLTKLKRCITSHTKLKFISLLLDKCCSHRIIHSPFLFVFALTTSRETFCQNTKSDVITDLHPTELNSTKEHRFVSAFYLPVRKRLLVVKRQSEQRMRHHIWPDGGGSKPTAHAISANAEDHTIRQHCSWSGTLSCMIIRQIEMQRWRAGRAICHDFYSCLRLRGKWRAVSSLL